MLKVEKCYSNSRLSAVRYVIEEIKKGLLNGQLEPGEKLPPEDEMCTIFGIGRSALREAIKLLEGLGIVKIERGKGTYITNGMSPCIVDSVIFSVLTIKRKPFELYELRWLLERGAMELAAARANEDDFRKLHNSIKELEYLQINDPLNIDKVAEEDMNFHRIILEAGKNTLLSRIGTAILELFEHSIKDSIACEEIGETIEIHKKILDSLRSGSKEKMLEAIRISLEKWLVGFEDRMVQR